MELPKGQQNLPSMTEPSAIDTVMEDDIFDLPCLNSTTNGSNLADLSDEIDNKTMQSNMVLQSWDIEADAMGPDNGNSSQSDTVKTMFATICELVPFFEDLKWLERNDNDDYKCDKLQNMPQIPTNEQREDIALVATVENKEILDPYTKPLVPTQASRSDSHYENSIAIQRSAMGSPVVPQASLETQRERAVPKLSVRLAKRQARSNDGIKCHHCGNVKTPQWRSGPYGPKTLCNACGVRYKSGKLYPEYRPAASPTSNPLKTSNSHKKVMELRLRNGVSINKG